VLEAPSPRLVPSFAFREHQPVYMLVNSSIQKNDPHIDQTPWQAQ
jgi:hypothetical protein